MKHTIIILIVSLFGLAACSGTPAADDAASGAVGAAGAAAQTDLLSDDYRDALPVAQQLALGTLSLENSDLAVSAEQAADLLPLWQVVQSLEATGNVAEVEMAAVLKQIQEAMGSEQVATIAALQLTAAKVQEMVDDGTLQMGRGAGARDGAGDGSGGPGGQGGAGGQGGPGGGFAGGGPGGGPGGELGVDPGMIETRQAELAASGENPLAAMLAQGSAGMVVRLLQNKLGQAPAFGGGLMDTAITAVSTATGLSVEEIRTQLSGGETLAAVISEHDGDETALREALAAALADTPLPPDRDLDSLIDELLQGTFTGGRPPAAE